MDAKGAVVLAALADGIDVGASDDGRSAIGALNTAPEVADGVEAGAQTGLVEPGPDEGHRPDPAVVVDATIEAAVRMDADLAKLIDASLEPVRVDWER